MSAKSVSIDYVDLKYKPKDSDLICRFYIEPKYGVAFDHAAEHVAVESSIGTWVKVQTLKSYVKKFTAHVFRLDPHNGIADIAYPYEAFEPDNIPEILSSIAGNVFGMKQVSKLKFLDVKFPKKIVKCYSGPRFGIDGVRKVLKVKNRPLLGTIIKPKMGLNPTDHAKVAFDAWIGGCDIVKDDENLCNQKFNLFNKRLEKTLKMRDKAEKITGERKVYMVNVTGPYGEMIDKAKLVKKMGGRYAMIDVITTGFSALQDFVKKTEKLRLVLHGHRAMHAAFDRLDHGIDFIVFTKLCRLVGIDQLHIGTIVGKMAGKKEEVLGCRDAAVLDNTPEDKNFLGQKWYGLNSMFPVASGGLHPGHVPKIVEYFGKDIIIQMGGGIHWNPRGTVYGAKGARQAIEAVMQGISLKEYAKTHRELREAIENFGIA